MRGLMRLRRYRSRAAYCKALRAVFAHYGLTMRRWRVTFSHMDQNDTPSVPASREGGPGGVRATLKLRDHGFEPKRDRHRHLVRPEQPRIERNEWLFWLADECGYDFGDESGDGDFFDVAPEHSFEMWKGMRNMQKIEKGLD